MEKQVKEESRRRQKLIAAALVCLVGVLAITQIVHQSEVKNNSTGDISVLQPNAKDKLDNLIGDHEVHASLIAALKEQSLRQEEQLEIMAKQLRDQVAQAQNLEEQLSCQEHLVEDFRAAERRLQTELESAQSEKFWLLAKIRQIEERKGESSEGLVLAQNDQTERLFSSQERGERVHTVAKGETLSAISQKYYGTTKKWNEIYEANKGLISNRNQIKPGIQLMIP